MTDPSPSRPAPGSVPTCPACAGEPSTVTRQGNYHFDDNPAHVFDQYTCSAAHRFDVRRLTPAELAEAAAAEIAALARAEAEAAAEAERSAAEAAAAKVAEEEAEDETLRAWAAEDEAERVAAEAQAERDRVREAEEAATAAAELAAVERSGLELAHGEILAQAEAMVDDGIAIDRAMRDGSLFAGGSPSLTDAPAAPESTQETAPAVKE